MKITNKNAIVLPASWTAPSVLILLTLINGFYNSMATAFGGTFPFNTFVFTPNDLLADFFKAALSLPGPDIHDIERWPQLYRDYLLHNPYGGVEALNAGSLSNLHGMPLPTFLGVGARYALTLHNPNLVAALFFSIAILPFSAFVWVYSHRASAGSISTLAFLLSYPLIFAVTRGNLTAILLGEVLIGALLLIWSGRSIWSVSLLLALAVNLRPNSMIFLALPLLRWSFRETALSGLVSMSVAAVIFFCSLVLVQQFYHDYTLANFFQALTLYHKFYAVGDAGLAYGSSLYGGIKFLNMCLGTPFDVSTLEIISVIISLSALALWLILALKGSWDVWSGLVVFVALYTLISMVFGDYHLIIFFGLLLILIREDKINYTPNVILSGALIILILAPKNYIFFQGVSIQTLLNPALLVILLLILTKPIRLLSSPSRQQ